jgi:membrane-associated phospholipid phosphatase
MALNALDRLTIVFAVVFSLAVVVRWPTDRPVSIPLLLFAAGLVLLAACAPRLRRGGGLARFFGDFYALILAVFMYTAIGVLNRAAGVSHDVLVQGWEESLFRSQPSLDWIRAQPWAWLSWPLHAAYLSYYVILAGAPLGLLLAGRRKEAAEAATLVMAAFYACYSVFAFFPVAGPRYVFTLAHNAATATLPARVTQRLLDSASAWGTAFPSSHVAAALTAGLAAGRGSRALGLVLTTAAVLLALGTVYGQFHYAVDAIAGALVAALVWALRHKILGNPLSPSYGRSKR